MDPKRWSLPVPQLPSIQRWRELRAPLLPSIQRWWQLRALHLLPSLQGWWLFRACSPLPSLKRRRSTGALTDQWNRRRSGLGGTWLLGGPWLLSSPNYRRRSSTSPGSRGTRSSRGRGSLTLGGLGALWLRRGEL